MLKFIAIFIMTVDHIAHYFVAYFVRNDLIPLYYLMRAIGRLAFPIFAYNVAKGYRRTRNIVVYGLRLLTFAFVSELILMNVCDYVNAINKVNSSFFPEIYRHPNTLFTLALGVLAITAWEMLTNSSRDVMVRMEPAAEGPQTPAPWQFRFNPGISLNRSTGTILGFIFLLLAGGAALHFNTDYDIYGIITVLIFHSALDAREEDQHFVALRRLAVFNTLIIAFAAFANETRLLSPEVFYWTPTQGFAVLALPLIFGIPESKKRPGPFQKYFFYIYYPLHLAIIMYLTTVIQSPAANLPLQLN